jgi:hypothetical protein
MSQIFHPSTNMIARLTIFGAVFGAGASLWVFDQINRSAYITQADVVRAQPVPFSHAHHVGDVGLDCRYCHSSVEESAFAGIPPTKTCMNCHAQLFADSPMLEPVRESFRTGKPIEWTRVHDLPDFVYFDHSIHVNKGVACVTCHGPIDRMALVWQQSSLLMSWCVDCHRHPELNLQPRDTVMRTRWEAPEDRVALGRELMERYGVRTRTDCSTCHR